MKKIFRILLLISGITFTVNSYSQVDDMGKFVASGIEDGQKLLEGYISPFINAFGASLSGGWYNTAKPHQLGGFDITATFNTAIVPTSDQTFDINELGLQNLVLDDPSSNIAPTIAGEKTDGPVLNYGPPVNLQAFSMPQGVNWRYVPTPMIQVGIGLIKDTEIMGRFTPTIKIGENNKGNVWGIGLKHGLKQWIPFIKKVPVLHLTVMGGYTRLNTSFGINVTPASIGLDALPVVDENGSNVSDPDWDDQKMEAKTSSFTGNLLISANLPVVCFYGGVGFATAKTTLETKGNYPLLSTEQLAVVQTVDPISMEIKFKDGKKTKPRLNAGMRFKFAVITLHFDYTWADYSIATVGLGVSIR
jgi:hypothetical protein